ncbi:MAG: hypothetical protein AAGD22_05340 [Verrucomicrobiota bacterium]
MIAFRTQLLHEWRCQYRRPFVAICGLIYFAIAFGDAYQTGLSASGFQWINGADAISTRAIILSLFGILAVAGVIGQATSLDREYLTEEFVFSTPVSRLALGLPRFLVGWLVCVAIGACFIPGMILGSMMPGVLPEHVGPTVPSHYLKAMAYYIAPNFFIIGAIAFAIGSRSRSQSATYLTGVGLLVLWILARMLIGQDVLRHDVFPLYALLEPFGSTASGQFAMERTIAQNNEWFVPFQGYLLWNRIIWIGIATLLLISSLASLPMQPAQPRISQSRQQSTKLAPSWIASSEFFLTLRWELLTTIRQPGIRLVLFLAALSLWFTASSAITHQFSLPTTDLLVHNTGFYFDKILILVLVWCAADLFCRETKLHVSEITDTLPTSDLTRYSAKTAALLLTILAFWLLAIAVNVIYQAANGFFHFQITLHLFDSLIVKAPFYLFMGIMALSLQALIRHRYIAIGAFLLIYVLPVLLDGIGIYHPLLRFGQSNFFWYSLMDGYGHFLSGHFWFLAYWSLGAALLWTLAAFTISRGTQPQAQHRRFIENLSSPLQAASLAVIFFAFVGTGWAIWHKSTIQNEWPPPSLDALKAKVEKTYGPSWRNRAQPRIIRMSYHLDIYPDERRFILDGEYTLANPHDRPIERLLVLAEPTLSVDELSFSTSASLVAFDESLNVQEWQLDKPMNPGDTLEMNFTTSWTPLPGFRARSENDNINEVGPTEILGNGTSLLNLQLMPAIGYTDRVEHKPRWKRRKYGLPLDWAAPSGSDALHQAHDTLHLDWVEEINATISTAPDQMPLHAGEIVSDTTLPDGRREISYQVTRPSRGWSAVLSGRYKAEEFSLPNATPFTIFHDPRYTYTLEEMAEIFAHALAYFEKSYGPPPFDDFKLAQQSLHFDGMGNRAGLGFATEILGWKSDLARSKGADIEKMAAHMMGMSWFGDQIIPANVAGAKVIHAGLPYWSAGLYLQDKQDPAQSRELRQQEMGELFRSRRILKDEESAFIQEHKDSTMIRRKGLILLTYLAELAGQKTITNSFREFLERYRYQPAPYPTAQNFVEILEEHVPEEYHPQIDDIFRQITRWDLRAVSATASPSTSGGWETQAVIDAKKFYTHGGGSEVESPLNTPIPVALFKSSNPNDAPVHHSIVSPPSGRSTIVLHSDEKPEWFFLDPDSLLPDPNHRNQAIPIKFLELEPTPNS